MANRIPRKFSYIRAESLMDTNACVKGMNVYIFKDDKGYFFRGKDNVLYRTFASHLRNENYFRIISVV